MPRTHTIAVAVKKTSHNRFISFPPARLIDACFCPVRRFSHSRIFHITLTRKTPQKPKFEDFERVRISVFASPARGVMCSNQDRRWIGLDVP